MKKRDRVKKNIRFKKIIIGILVSASLSGCQSIPTAHNPNISEALQIMQVDGRAEGLRDVSREEMDKVLKLGGDNSAELAMAAGHAGNFLRAPAGLSSSTAAGMHLFFFFTSSNSMEGEFSRLMVWAPESFAANERQAQIKMSDMIGTAVREALPPGYNTKIQEWTDVSTIGVESHYKVIRVNGPYCPDWSCVIRGDFPSKDRLPVRGRMSKTSTPFFLGDINQTSYRFDRYYNVLIQKVKDEHVEKGKVNGQWYRLKTEYLKDFDHADWYTRISNLLPKWAYYYHAPRRRNPEQSVFPYPVILHKGKPMYFVKPGSYCVPISMQLSRERKR